MMDLSAKVACCCSCSLTKVDSIGQLAHGRYWAPIVIENGEYELLQVPNLTRLPAVRNAS